MRACASGQTFDQQKLYGSYVTFFHELAVPEAREPPLALPAADGGAGVRRALAPVPGPVHLNAPFRYPPPPLAHAWQQAVGGRLGEIFRPAGAAGVGGRPGGVPALVNPARGVIVAGPAQPADPEAYAAPGARSPAAWAGRSSPTRCQPGDTRTDPAPDDDLRCGPAQPVRGRGARAGRGALPRGLADQQGPAGLARAEQGADLARDNAAGQPRRPPWPTDQLRFPPGPGRRSLPEATEGNDDDDTLAGAERRARRPRLRLEVEAALF